MLGGSTADTLDPHKAVSFLDNVRAKALFDALVTLNIAGTGVTNVLAEELIPNKKATAWTIRLRKGVTFHDGKPLTAADVIYTFRRIANPKKPLDGGPNLQTVDLNGLRAVDSHTVFVPMKTPTSSFPLQLSNSYNFGIVPVGFNANHPVGTGAFKYHSFTPGQQSVFVRNANYWRSGQPYLDQLTITNFNDPTAAYNSVASGALHMYAGADYSVLPQAKGAGLQVLLSGAGEFNPMMMLTTHAPFKDVRVRQAFRLIAGRSQIAEEAYSGYSQPAYDTFGWFDSCHDSSLVRKQDLQQAKSLLRAAGYRSGLTVQLTAAPVSPGVVQNATVFATQAARAGVNVKVNQVTTTVLYGPRFGTWPFYIDFWAYGAYMTMASLINTTGAVYNTAHWNNARYDSLYKQANATLNHARSCEIQHEMQMIEFNEGSSIIPTRNRIADIHTKAVQGLYVSPGTLAAGNGMFYNMWLAH
jgi:peptide/nickel transport system substrate-binding protein